jgi:endonuclease YncB( thermonuclease family)
MESVDYVDTFIAVAPDSRARRATPPTSRSGQATVAERTYRMIAAHPYRYTSGDVIFTVYADRHDIPEAERGPARRAFYAKGQPCLRSSDLGKRYGWGIHADDAGRVALVGIDTPEYAEFASGRRPGLSGSAVTVVAAMRTRRATGHPPAAPAEARRKL